jgi:hypothetical protein
MQKIVSVKSAPQAECIMGRHEAASANKAKDCSGTDRNVWSASTPSILILGLNCAKSVRVIKCLSCRLESASYVR